jgi:hypothetical protein
MKTPRLPLALLALALAPFANAGAFPQWPIVEEGSRSWPQVRFSVGGKPRVLQCRYSECNPKAPKGMISLYLLTKTSESKPTKVKIYRGVERGRWNPARLYDGPMDYVPETINAQAWTYTSEMSHYKLDTTGAALFVVQGKERYPATTDIDERQYNSYDQMKVAPSTKMFDDELKPAGSTPAPTVWWCNQSTGDKRGLPAAQKPPAGYTRIDSRSSVCGKKPAGPANPERTLSKLPSAGKWKDAITPVGEWRAIQTSVYPIVGIPVPLPTMTFYCYHEKMDGDKDLATHLKKHPLIVECVNWSAPAGDATKQEGVKKYKVRNNLIQFDLGFVNGKLRIMNGAKGALVTEMASFPDTLGGEKFVKVTSAQAAPADGALLLSEKELIWLDRRQAREYAAEKSAVDAKPAAEKGAAAKALAEKTRKLVVENLAPNTTASSAYAAAAADPKATPESIDKTLPAQVWGGPNDAIVAESGPRTEIQLSKEDWDALSKVPPAKPEYTAALETYRRDRTPSNGQVGQVKEYRKDVYDPIVLHRLSEAARKVLGTSAKPPVGTTPEEELLALLTEEQKQKYLTPSEIANYESILNSAPKPKVKDKNVQAELKKLYAKIKEREGSPYPKDGLTKETFDAAPAWQKDKFCNPAKIGGAVASSGPKQTDAVLNANGDATAALSAADKKLREEAAARQKAASAGGSALPPWAVEKCKGSPFSDPTAANPPGNTGSGTGTGNIGAKVPVPPGVDVENKEKEKSKWLTSDLLTSAAKGAMVGLLVGSLFGPVGLVAGPILGGALFYGLTKITE